MARYRSATRLTSLLLAAAIGAIDARSGDAKLRQDLIGQTQVYAPGPQETFVDIARKFDLGYVEMLAANPGIDPWLPDPDTALVIPSAHLLPEAPRRGIVINLAELRLYYFASDGAEILTFPIGIGSEGTETPEGETYVALKRVNPTWIPPESIRREKPHLPSSVGPGPDNPLGAYALNLQWAGYAIHGTNRPAGVGRRVSHGCIRLYPEDIERLFALVAVGTPVRIVHQAVKAGWSGDALYVEVHPDQRDADELEAGGALSERLTPPIGDIVRRAAGATAKQIDWLAVHRAAARASGVPVEITR